jgi:hypothetical protein
MPGPRNRGTALRCRAILRRHAGQDGSTSWFGTDQAASSALQAASSPIASSPGTGLAIDGRSNSGKTTLAARISELVPGSVVIGTDDIAWEHSRFGWAGLPMDGILVPVHRGRAVSYRPPRWYSRGREGSLEVPAGCPLLIIEGDGAWPLEVAHLIDTVIWVQADEREAGRRAAARAADRPATDLANRAVGGAPFDEDGWMAEENTLQHRPADLGTRRPYRLRHPADPLRPEHPNRHRTASGDILVHHDASGGRGRALLRPGPGDGPLSARGSLHRQRALRVSS